MPSSAATAARHKPRLSFWDIWNMSFGFLGIQFGFALQNANVSRIFETLGAKVENLSLFWIAAPVTGAAIQRMGMFSTLAPRVSKIRLTLAFWSAKPI